MVVNFKDIGKDYVEVYEKLNKKFHNVYSVTAKSLIEFADLPTNEPITVLDIGCGTGISSLEIYKKLPEGSKLICLDISEEMLKKVRERLRDKKVEVEILKGDALELPSLIKKEIDYAFSNFTYYYFLKDLKKYFANVYAILKKGGKFAFNITSYFTPIEFEDKKYNQFGKILIEEAEKVLKENGYEGTGGFNVNLDLVNNCEKPTKILKEVGFKEVNCRISKLPLSPIETLDFTYEGFFKWGSKVSFSKTLSELPFERRLKLIEGIIERAKKRFEDEEIKESPTVFELVATK